jgi:hypothetical protein
LAADVLEAFAAAGDLLDPKQAPTVRISGTSKNKRISKVTVGA